MPTSRTLMAALVLAWSALARAQPATHVPHVVVAPPSATGAAAHGASGERVLSLREAPVTAAVLRAHEAPRAVPLAAQPVALRPGDVLVTRTAAPAIRRPVAENVKRGTDRWALPYQVRFIDPQGVVRTSHLVAEVGGGGLRMTAASQGAFGGVIYLGLVDEQDRTRPYALPAPAQVVVTAPVDRIDPGSFAFDATNTFKEVSLQALDPPDALRARIRAFADPQGLELDIPVERPRLSIRVSPGSIQGFGLETATVEVLAEGLPQPSGRTVTLTASRGGLTRTAVSLDDQGRGETGIRSIAMGRTEVEALSPPLRGARTGATFTGPWAFLIAALVGGVIGAVIRRNQAEGKRSRRRPLPVDLLTGALVGLVVTVLYAVGVNLLPVEPSATVGEALVFGLAAVGGFIGLSIPKAKAPA